MEENMNLLLSTYDISYMRLPIRFLDNLSHQYISPQSPGDDHRR